MALRLSRDLEVWWPVPVRQPADDGKVVDHEINLFIRVPTQASIRALFEDAEGPDAEALRAEDKWIAGHVLDWRDVHDANGEAMEFCSEGLSLLLDSPGGRKAVVAALLAVASGKDAAPKKTSPKSRAGGHAATATAPN